MNAFSKACEISGPLRLAVRGPSPSESGVRLLHQPFALVGRDPRADVSLDHNMVSRRHVYLQFVNGRMFWLDLDSRSGTTTDGQLRKLGWLEVGSSIRVGPFGLERVASSAPGTENREARLGLQLSPLVARSYWDLSLPDVSLEFLNGPSRSACWPMNRVMSLIGSASGCKFRLADPSVSAFHCSLLRTPLGVWLVDLLGPDGTGVNDAQVRFAVLAHDDVLSVGRYRIRMRVRSASTVTARSASEKSAHTLIAQTGSTARFPLAAVFSDGDVAASPSLPVHSWQVLASQVLAPRIVSGEATNNELVLPTSNMPAQLEKAEIAESLLVPLMNQFGLMQQQMLDQFQQAISTIVQAFGNLHRDQMATIREELDQLRDLTREFHAIKHEIAARSRDPGATVSAESSKSLDDLRISASDTRVQNFAESARPAAVNAAPRASVEVPTPAPGPSPVVDSAVGASPFQTALGAFASEPPQVKQPQPKPKETAPESDRDVMVWLHQRMMVLQEERESRWRKILKLLPGLS